jgi:pSer/pThr/pTyr-binding forkhead associated (FHA) protein
MAYGRLDVYWSNGDFRSFLLEQDNVSIGRSAGSTVVLDTDTISRYHTRIRHEDGRTFISDMDSANGTFLDGVQLEKDVEKEIFGGEEIQIGQLRIIFFRQDEQATAVINTPLEVETQPYSREDHGFYVDISTPETGVPPGSHKSVEISLTNTSKQEQRYTVSITGLPAG